MGNVTSKSVISQCLDWLDIPECVTNFLDYRIKKLTCRAAICLFIEAQLSDRKDPDSIVEHLRGNKELQALTGISSLSASQFSRRLDELPTWLLQYMLQQINIQLKATLKESCLGKTLPKFGKLSIIDSTSIMLPSFHGNWAYCSKEQNKVKLHLRLCTEQPDLSVPSKVILSTGAVTDQELSIELVTEQGTTYVMDRGYINFKHYKKWINSGILFVARIQARNKTNIVEKRQTPVEDTNLLLDADVEIAVPKEPGEVIKLRLVEYKDDKDRSYRVVTNRWDLSAREVADIYKGRWEIELYFKWMKQYLRLARLYSFKPTAVWNQIYMALLANALNSLVRLQTQTKKPRCVVWKLMREYMTASWETFLEALFRPPTRTSKGRKKKAKRGRPRIHPEKKVAQKKIVSCDFF